MKAVAVVGNPKPASRTRDAAERVAAGLGAKCETLELSQLGPALLGWGDPTVGEWVEKVQSADIAIVASPTFKATYTGLLKLFLDQFAGGTGMQGVVAVPMMLGGGMGHALAPELTLRPVLSEIGASCPASALYLVDSTYDSDGVLSTWVERWSAVIHGAASAER